MVMHAPADSLLGVLRGQAAEELKDLADPRPPVRRLLAQLKRGPV